MKPEHVAIELLKLAATLAPAVLRILQRGTAGATEGSLEAQVRALLPTRGRSAAMAETLRSEIYKP